MQDTVDFACQTDLDIHTIDEEPAYTKRASVTNQLDFVLSIKTTISEKMTRHLDRPASGIYPFPSLMVYPDDPLSVSLIPDVRSFYLRPVFVFLPEFYWPHIFPKGRPPCPNCSPSQERVVVNNWIQTRRVILDNQCADLLGFRYFTDTH